jgi:hypothetical protein
MLIHNANVVTAFILKCVHFYFLNSSFVCFQNYFWLHSTPSSFADLRIAVLLIHLKIIVGIFVHRGVGPSLFRGRSCAGARSITQQRESARLAQSLCRYRATPSVH